MRLLVPEIFELLAAAEGTKERVAVLQKHADNTLMKEVLRINFDAAVVFDLPKGNPPFKRSAVPANMADSNFYAESRRLYLLIKDHPRRPAGLKKLQIEGIFIQMLEGVNALEADMLMALKDKALTKKYKGLTEAVVRQAFPDLLPVKAEEAQ
jgi:hypothetical protein